MRQLVPAAALPSQPCDSALCSLTLFSLLPSRLATLVDVGKVVWLTGNGSGKVLQEADLASEGAPLEAVCAR